MLHRIFRPLRFGTGLALLTLLGLSIVGCAAQQEEEKAAPPVAGSFVGEAPPADAFIAIVADLPEGEGDERQVRAYLCDGQTVSDWFWGSVDGNNLSLTSDNGAELEGQLTPDAATGTIRDPNGDAISFEAPLATGIGGLYNVNVSSDGSLSGTSELGAQLEGQLGNILEENDSYPVSGTITPPDGQPEEFKALTSPNTSDDHRWIVLPDGQIKGGNFGGGFETDGFVFERQFDCDFDGFDDFDFNHCEFDFNQFVFVNNFDDFDFDRGRNEVGGTFGQVGGGQDGGGGKDGGGKGGGGQDGGGGKDGGGGQGGGKGK